MTLIIYNTSTSQIESNNTIIQKFAIKSQVSTTQINIKLLIKLKVSNNKNLSKSHKVLTFTYIMKKITHNL